jgi:hypothetical protein
MKGHKSGFGRHECLHCCTLGSLDESIPAAEHKNMYAGQMARPVARTDTRLLGTIEARTCIDLRCSEEERCIIHMYLYTRTTGFG